MPQSCCVPQCFGKGYIENGTKISYHKFPEDKLIFRRWIVAIRRDVGRHFEVTKHTRVCSRHFLPDDYCFSFANRKRTLKRTAVPSVFTWKKDSPAKRNPPRKRSLCVDGEDSSSPVNVSNVVHDDDYNHEQFSLPAEILNQPPKTVPVHDLQATIEELKAMNSRLLQENDDLKAEINELNLCKTSLEKRSFNVDKLVESDKDLTFYTGFPSRAVFDSVLDFLNPGEDGENINYWYGATDSDATASGSTCDKTTRPAGRPRQLRPREEFFLTLCRLRQGFPEQHTAHLFGIHLSTVSRIINTWINFMYLKFSPIPLWPSRDMVNSTMPDDFHAKYPSTRVIIDCTEVKCQAPSSLFLNSKLYSSYKNHTTLKGLVGITPGGALSFVSQLYTGRISDRELVQRSGFLDQQFDTGDDVMADKGFTIDDLLPPGVTLNIPPFLGSEGQMSSNDVIKTQSIASLRIHVERAINKIKNFHIWDRVLPLNVFGIVNQMWTVCAFLCNMQKPIIS